MALLKIHTIAPVALALLLSGVLCAEEMAREEMADAAAKKPEPAKPAKPGKEGKRMAPDRGYELIMENRKELGISDEQKKQLEDLHYKVMEQFEKMKSDPEMADLFREAYEARQGGDKDHAKEVRRKIRAAMEKKGGPTEEKVMLDFARILTREQLTKLAELREKNGMDPNPMKSLREEKKEEKDAAVTQEQRPDPNKGAPSLYDNEK
jgi:hypothetical protein